MHICKMQNCIILRAVFFLRLLHLASTDLSGYQFAPQHLPQTEMLQRLNRGKERGLILIACSDVNVLRPHITTNKNRNSMPVNSQWNRPLWWWQHADLAMRFHYNRAEWIEHSHREITKSVIKFGQKNKSSEILGSINVFTFYNTHAVMFYCLTHMWDYIM